MVCVLATAIFTALLAGVVFLETLRESLRRESLARLDPSGLAQLGPAFDHVSDGDILLLGDSRLAALQLPDSIQDHPVTNLAVPGSTTAQTRVLLAQLLTERRPRLVLVQCGINDLKASGYGVPRLQLAKEAVLNISAMASLCRDTEVDLLVTTVLPPGQPEFWRRPLWPDRFLDRVDDFNIELGRTLPPDMIVPQIEIDLLLHFSDALHSDEHTNQLLAARFSEAISHHLNTITALTP